MRFKTLIKDQKLIEIDIAKFKHVCADWNRFARAVAIMDRPEVLRLLKFLIEDRPHAKTLGRRAVQRFNSINRVRWDDLIK